MRDISFFNKIFIATSPVDFRKQAHGLATIVEHSLKLPATAKKSLYVFTNKKRSAVKILYWDDTGYALWWKTLEKDKFRWPSSNESSWCVEAKQLRWLLEGVDLSKIKIHEKFQ